MRATIKIKNEEVLELLGGHKYSFPKYTTQIINLANQNAGGTKPKVVGQMSDLIQEFQGKLLEEWITWYSKQMPNAVQCATDKIYEMLQNLKTAIELIDRAMIEDWVKDLVFNKTFAGLLFQEAILKRIAEMRGTVYRLSDPPDEAKGIDGYIGDTPVSIKPKTYDLEKSLGETIDVSMIYYDKKKDSIEINYDL